MYMLGKSVAMSSEHEIRPTQPRNMQSRRILNLRINYRGGVACVLREKPWPREQPVGEMKIFQDQKVLSNVSFQYQSMLVSLI